VPTGSGNLCRDDHLDHLTIFVRDNQAAARWYAESLGFEVEFVTPDGVTTAIRDDRDFTIFLTNRVTNDDQPRCVLYFEMPNVDTEYERLMAFGVESIHAPRENPWGHGPEVRDLDGHTIRLWDARSMK
jgi:uncharacterized glyoxalase superfamily protein PhnB